ncbi:MAG: DUF898 domain-containing protein [Burkholderiales bacterium]|nr:DUF898 domain-containing protein [Burkholderiales bacterium]
MERLSTSSTHAAIDFEFTGTGRDYFRIWIVNIALTIVTLGIYSAWAKVRRLQYFYRNTRVAGASFDYHGKPVAILIGRLIAAALLIGYHVTAEFNPILMPIVLIPMMLALPWMLRQSLRFRLHYSSWRGLRFAFRGTVAGAYRVFLLWPVLTAVSLYLLGPMLHHRLKRYQHDHSFLGSTAFSMSALARSFYRPYAIVFLWFLASAVTVGLLVVSAAEQDDLIAILSILPMLFLIGFMMLCAPYMIARIQNLIWNSTNLGSHRFESRLEARKLAWIMATNLLLTVVTLGLFRPFAAVRMARYRVSSMVLLPGSALDEFVATEKANVAAMGQELAEFLDIDIAL